MTTVREFIEKLKGQRIVDVEPDHYDDMDIDINAGTNFEITLENG